MKSNMADIVSKKIVFKIRTFWHQQEPYPTIIFEIMTIFIYKNAFLSAILSRFWFKLVLLLWYKAVHPPSPKLGHIKWRSSKSFHPILTNFLLFFLSCYALTENKVFESFQIVWNFDWSAYSKVSVPWATLDTIL